MRSWVGLGCGFWGSKHSLNDRWCLLKTCTSALRLGLQVPRSAHRLQHLAILSSDINTRKRAQARRAINVVVLSTQDAPRIEECFMLGTAPLSNSWIISIIWLYIALNRTPNIDCYWGGAVPKLYGYSGSA